MRHTFFYSFSSSVVPRVRVYPRLSTGGIRKKRGCCNGALQKLQKEMQHSAWVKVQRDTAVVAAGVMLERCSDLHAAQDLVPLHGHYVTEFNSHSELRQG